MGTKQQQRAAASDNPFCGRAEECFPVATAAPAVPQMVLLGKLCSVPWKALGRCG